MILTFNPLDAANLEDPYPLYERIHRVGGADAVGIFSGPIVYTYDDVVTCLRDHETFSSAPFAVASRGARSVLASDPPEHTDLRRLVTKPFTPSAILALEPRIREIARELVDEMIVANHRGEADLVTNLSSPLPVIVIAEMLGIPADRRDDFKRWSDLSMSSAAQMMGLTNVGSPSQMERYFAGIIEERKLEPRDDLISSLVTGPEPLTPAELLMFCVLLLIAGNETTTNLISNATLAFFEYPDQEELVRSDHSLIPSAMEETLRFDSPVQFLMRSPRHDLQFGGREMVAGQVILALLGAANRDAAKYPDPDRFDVRRNPRDHVGFGSGIHLCLGAALARLESRIAFEELFSRTRNLRPTGFGERGLNPIVRGFRRMPVAFDEVA